MMQIPRHMLTGSMTVKLPDPEADYAGTWAEERTVSGVCFQRREQLGRSSWSLAEGASGRVFVDAVNSAGAFEVPVGARVEIAGRSMECKACQAYEAFGRVHHWEVDVG